MNETISFQEVIEYVENLSQEDQDFLVELIKKRKIEKRRLEIAKNAEQTLAALSAGTAKKGTVADLLKTKKPFPVTKIENHEAKSQLQRNAILAISSTQRFTHKTRYLLCW